MDLRPLDIIVIKSRVWQPMDWFIYKHTSSMWGHCAVVKKEDGTLFDPRLKGIVDNPISKYESRGFKVRRYKYDFDREKVMAWCLEKQKKSKHYDFISMIGFATGIKRLNNPNAWYCSEFPYWMHQENGSKLTDEELCFVYPDFFMKCNDFITVV